MTDGGNQRDGRATVTVDLGRTGGWIALAGLVVVLLAVVWGLIPAHEPTFRDPNFLEVIFASRLTLTFARLAVVAGSAYIVISVFALVARRQWISSVGPIRVQESVRTLDAETQRLEGALSDALTTIEDLKQERLDRVGDEVAVTEVERDEHLAELRQVLDDSRSRASRARATLRKAGYLRSQ